jgi:lipoyl(octanoyl) transferase
MNIVAPGRLTFAEGLALQERLVAQVAAGGDESLVLLEHEPVYTIGRTRDHSSLSGIEPYPVHETNRGGQATYHGPGQLTGYPILDLNKRGRDLHAYLRFLEGFLIEFCAAHGVEASRREGLTGVWVGSRKIASLGVGVRKWITMHGFAINILKSSVEPFSHITPCGISGVEMTSLEGEAGVEIDFQQALRSVGEEFQGVLPMLGAG